MYLPPQLCLHAYKGKVALGEPLLPNLAQFCWHSCIYTRDFADISLSASGYVFFHAPRRRSRAVEVFPVTWGWGAERGTRGCERDRMSKLPPAAGQEWSWSSLSIILSCCLTLLTAPGTAASLLDVISVTVNRILLALWKSLAQCHNFLLKTENLVLIKKPNQAPDCSVINFYISAVLVCELETRSVAYTKTKAGFSKILKFVLLIVFTDNIFECLLNLITRCLFLRGTLTRWLMLSSWYTFFLCSCDPNWGKHQHKLSAVVYVVFLIYYNRAENVLSCNKSKQELGFKILFIHNINP